MTWKLRRARADDKPAIARLYRRTAGREWNFLYPHTPQDDLRHFGAAVDRGPVWVAEAAGEIVGFCAARRGWIDHLYVDHAWHGRGVGQDLLKATLRRRRRVRLWTFQVNTRSRRFYRLQGFCEIRVTNGADNEEKEPDVLLEWRA
ncbi:MAG TPA: GNAT family N-acetyltransferase [Caulobacteraceae bacterium]|jgi:ribosomal protein S18 acetylase RimI-like enzyme|nr:GNAT family N-acetyltransferase [Caulobacteraceae bacterium]